MEGRRVLAAACPLCGERAAPVIRAALRCRFLTCKNPAVVIVSYPDEPPYAFRDPLQALCGSHGRGGGRVVAWLGDAAA